MKYAVLVRFNGRISKGVVNETIEADSPGEAIDLVTSKAVRSRAGGGSIFVTGLHVEELIS